MMAAKSLLGCPEEVRLAIIELIPPSDLAALSLACKDLQRLIEPYLYSRINITWSYNTQAPLMLLIRTLLDRPGLGRFVRVLRLDGDDFYNPDGESEYEPPTLPPCPLPLSKFLEAVTNTGVLPIVDEIWTTQVQAGKGDATTALLLSMLPDLTCIHLGPNFTVQTRFLGKMLRFILCERPERFQSQRMFQNIRKVTLSPRANESTDLTTNNANDVLPLFYLPSVEHLSLSIDNPDTFTWPSKEPPEATSLSTLEVFRLRENGLEELLSSVKGLKKLRWHWFYRPDLDQAASTEVVDFNVMNKALSHARETMEELEIIADTHPAISWGDFEPAGVDLRGYLDLTNMNRLRKLSVPWAFMVGFEPSEPSKCLEMMLPQKLEEISFTRGLVGTGEWEWDEYHEVILDMIRPIVDGRKKKSNDKIAIGVPLPPKVIARRRGELERRIGAELL